MIKIEDFLKLMKNGEVYTETGCDAIKIFIRTDNYRIHVLDDKIYTSIDNLPNKNVNVYGWEFNDYYTGETVLDIWCKN